MQGAPQHRAFGFTLLELIIVLVMVGLMLLLAPPLFSGVAKGAKATASARELAAALQKARSFAIARQTESVLLLDVKKKRYAVNDKSRQLPAHLSYQLDTARSEQLNENVGGIRFFPDGSATGGRITVRSDTRKLDIDVEWLTGRVTVYAAPQQ